MWLPLIFCFLAIIVLWVLSFTYFKTQKHGYEAVEYIYEDVFDASKHVLQKKDRVILNGEDDTIQNGIYVWNGNRLIRANDMKSDDQLSVGGQVYVKALREAVILQVMPGDTHEWMGITCGIKFISMTEQVFGEMEHTGLLHATDEGFEFVKPQGNTFTIEVNAGEKHFQRISLPKKSMTTFCIVVAGKDIYWRATVLLVDEQMRLMTSTKNDNISINVPFDVMSPRRDLTVTIVAPEKCTLHVQTQ